MILSYETLFFCLEKKSTCFLILSSSITYSVLFHAFFNTIGRPIRTTSSNPLPRMITGRNGRNMVSPTASGSKNKLPNTTAISENSIDAGSVAFVSGVSVLGCICCMLLHYFTAS